MTATTQVTVRVVAAIRVPTVKSWQQKGGTMTPLPCDPPAQ